MRRVHAAIVMLVAGCTGPTPQPLPGVAALGETVAVGKIEVTPRALLEDSRCPQAVRCAWQGRVRLEIDVGGSSHELTLGQPLPIAGGALMLVEVRPPRKPEAAIELSDYRFRFSFTT